MQDFNSLVWLWSFLAILSIACLIMTKSWVAKIYDHLMTIARITENPFGRVLIVFIVFMTMPIMLPKHILEILNDIFND